MLWFILVVTFLDQLRRQFAALGFGSRNKGRHAERSRDAPTDLHPVESLVVFLLGGIIAVGTFEPAVQSGISLIRIVGTLDVTRFVLFEFVPMVVSFITFASATRALDRLIIGSIRKLSSD